MPGNLTAADEAVNARMQLLSPAETVPSPEDQGGLPALRIGDVLVFVYSDHGVLRVSVDLDDVDRETSPFEVYGRDECVPMVISVQGLPVYRAGPPGGVLP